MKHPYQQFEQLQVLMMFLTLILGAIALVYGHLLLALFTCFSLALSFTFEALVEWKKQNSFQFIQQVLRALIIIVFVIFLYIK
ncbi:hypothetical protein [Aquibacillus saliphilus]|uniref:hypothetical protein n=1 Tax=Aquibacillus saliphilus TaxID=1909422 RepID=UPI001CF022A7|nr:hypothetical protein [Aquibacillus saliphilus]